MQEGAKYLEKPYGGRGVLMAGVPRRTEGPGGGPGSRSCWDKCRKIAVGMGADVTVLDINIDKMEYLEDIYQGKINTVYSTPQNILACLRDADMVIGAVLIPGAVTPKLIKAEYLKYMKKGCRYCGRGH